MLPYPDNHHAVTSFFFYNRQPSVALQESGLLTRQPVFYALSIGFRSLEGSQIPVGFEGCDLLSEKCQFTLGLLQPYFMLVAADGAAQPF